MGTLCSMEANPFSDLGEGLVGVVRFTKGQNWWVLSNLGQGQFLAWVKGRGLQLGGQKS